MPLCNRIDPWGRLSDNPSKAGLVMGNRGILHDEHRNIVKRWTTIAWVACDPNYRAISRKPLFSPGSYSELFFLDEATAFSAGHRPCAYCQRNRFNAFKAAWAASVPHKAGEALLPIGEIDRVLHRERTARGVEKITFSAQVDGLPDGCMFALGTDVYLVHRGAHLRWSFNGYARAAALPLSTEVSVLTPRTMLLLYAKGFRPSVHPSADA